MTPEERVRTVLLAPPSVTMAELSRQIGLSRTAAQLIRKGILYPHVLPELPRQSNVDRNRRCWQCSMALRNQRFSGGNHGAFEQWCSLGYPESTDPRYAVECPAFVQDQGRDRDQRPEAA